MTKYPQIFYGITRIFKSFLFVLNIICMNTNKTQKKMTPESNPEILKLQGIYEPKKKLLLVTGHRRENIGAGFLELIDALRELASNPSLQII